MGWSKFAHFIRDTFYSMEQRVLYLRQYVYNEKKGVGLAAQIDRFDEGKLHTVSSILCR